MQDKSKPEQKIKTWYNNALDIQTPYLSSVASANRYVGLKVKPTNYQNVLKRTLVQNKPYQLNR